MRSILYSRRTGRPSASENSVPLVSDTSRIYICRGTSVPRGVHRLAELQQLSPLGDSRCSYLNNIPNSLAALTRDSPASHHSDHEHPASFFRSVATLLAGVLRYLMPGNFVSRSLAQPDKPSINRSVAMSMLNGNTVCWARGNQG